MLQLQLPDGLSLHHTVHPAPKGGQPLCGVCGKKKALGAPHHCDGGCFALWLKGVGGVGGQALPTPLLHLEVQGCIQPEGGVGGTTPTP